MALASEVSICNKNHSLVSSYTHAVEFNDRPKIIGERINPTGKSRFKQALRDQDLEYIYKDPAIQ